MSTYKYLPDYINDAITGETVLMPDHRTNHVVLKLHPSTDDEQLIYLTTNDARDLGIKLIEMAHRVVGEMVSRDTAEYFKRNLDKDRPKPDLAGQIAGVELSQAAIDIITEVFGIGSILDEDITPAGMAEVINFAVDKNRLSDADLGALERCRRALIDVACRRWKGATGEDGITLSFNRHLGSTALGHRDRGLSAFRHKTGTQNLNTTAFFTQIVTVTYYLSKRTKPQEAQPVYDFFGTPLQRHLDDADRVIAAGAQLPASWLTLRDRHAEPETESMSLRYIDSVITGHGDRVLLKAAAIAEARQDHQAEAAVRNVLAAAIARELMAIYQPVAADIYAQMAKNFDTAVARMAKCCSTVDVLSDPASLLQATGPQRSSWAEAGAIAAECDSALDSLAASARMAGVEVELETNDQLIALVARAGDYPGVRIRDLWADWTSESRAGRWPRCLWAKANSFDAVVPIDKPPAMQTRMVQAGYGWRQESYDPLAEPAVAR